MIIAWTLLASSLAAAPLAAPFAAVEAAWLAKGYDARERQTAASGELSASAAIYTPRAGGGDRLEVHVLAKGRAYLGYTHPSTIERLGFDPSPAGRFADMLHDGSRTLAYHATRTSLGATELSILRWSRFKIERVAVFPEGRFLRLDDTLVVASRELPLGRYLSMGCESFGTISRTAFKTTLSAARNGKFVAVSSEHPGYFEAEIARKEAAMAGLKDELQKNAGEYLGLALSTYYDYAALGRTREGWTRLRALFKIPAPAPAAVKRCMSSMEKDLRAKLNVPSAWP